MGVEMETKIIIILLRESLHERLGGCLSLLLFLGIVL